MSLYPEELAGLHLAIETLKRSSLAVEADDLLNLRELTRTCRTGYEVANHVEAAAFPAPGRCSLRDFLVSSGAIRERPCALLFCRRGFLLPRSLRGRRWQRGSRWRSS